MESTIPVLIFTDGSCNTKHRIGGWAAILLNGNDKITIKGTEPDTTNNRMELTAAIKSIELAAVKFPEISIILYTDSQYIENLPQRKNKLENKEFKNKKGEVLQNSDLVQKLLFLIQIHNIQLIKIKAHKKNLVIYNSNSEIMYNYNLEVDQLARKIVRKAVNDIF